MADAGAEAAAGRPAGLGRPLRDVLELRDQGQAHTQLFGSVDERDVLVAALDGAIAFGSTRLADDLWGWSSLREEGAAVTRLAGQADSDAAWSLADALRRAAATQLPVLATDRQAICLALPAGPGASIGIRRAGRRLTPREQLVVQAVAAACVLAGP